MNTPKNIIVHHTVTPQSQTIAKTEASIERTHRDRGFPVSSLSWHIGYNYICYTDGTIRQYRKDGEVGAHTKEQNMNFESIGVALQGDFDHEMPSVQQISALRGLLKLKVEQYHIPLTNIYPHRKFANYKSCYGNKLADDWARNLMGQFKTQIYKGEKRIALSVSDEAQWIQLCRVYGLDPNQIDENVA